MKRMVLLVTAVVAIMPTATRAAEPSLASVMDRFSRKPKCGERFMGVRFNLIAKTSSAPFDLIVSRLTTISACLERRNLIGMAFPKGSARDGSYHEFKESGRVAINPDIIAHTGETADFELTLGQPPTGLLNRERPRLGTLVITHRNGTTQHFILPDSLTIAAAGPSAHFIYGEILLASNLFGVVLPDRPGRGAAVISLLIESCGVDGCG